MTEKQEEMREILILIERIQAKKVRPKTWWKGLAAKVGNKLIWIGASAIVGAILQGEAHAHEHDDPPESDSDYQSQRDPTEEDLSDFHWGHIDPDDINWDELDVEGFDLERLREVKNRLQESLGRPD